jgi:hypothetical protein
MAVHPSPERFEKGKVYTLPKSLDEKSRACTWPSSA